MEKFDNDCETQNKADVGDKERLTRVKELLFSDKCQFSEKREAKKLAGYKKKQEKPKIPNKAQLERGVDHPLRRIQYGQLGKKYVDQLNAELSRGLNFDAGLNFTSLKNLLKQDEMVRLGSDNQIC